jgi:hypothetical protein
LVLIVAAATYNVDTIALRIGVSLDGPKLSEAPPPRESR